MERESEAKILAFGQERQSCPGQERVNPPHASTLFYKDRFYKNRQGSNSQVLRISSELIRLSTTQQPISFIFFKFCLLCP
jgi:hypothetical protein